MAETDKTDNHVPGMLESWGLETKTARPKSVGPDDVKKNQEDPANPGLSPEADYKPGPGTNEASAGPAGTEANIPVKEATEIKPGAKRDAPPLRSTILD